MTNRILTLTLSRSESVSEGNRNSVLAIAYAPQKQGVSQPKAEHGVLSVQVKLANFRFANLNSSLNLGFDNFREAKVQARVTKRVQSLEQEHSQARSGRPV